MSQNSKYVRDRKYHYKIKDFESIDWTKQDVVIAQKHGVSRERIRQLRGSLGKPKPENYRKYSELSSASLNRQKLMDKIQKNKVKLSRMGLLRIAVFLKTHVPMASALLRALGVKHKDDRFAWEWSLFNFDLPNTSLHDVWGVPESSVARRRAKIKCPAKWRRVQGTVSDVDIDAYKKALQAEKKKADKWTKNEKT